MMFEMFCVNVIIVLSYDIYFVLKNSVDQEKLHWPKSLWYFTFIVGHDNRWYRCSCTVCNLSVFTKWNPWKCVWIVEVHYALTTWQNMTSGSLVKRNEFRCNVDHWSYVYINWVGLNWHHLPLSFYILFRLPLTWSNSPYPHACSI
jgi:hypothetical protein